MSYGRCDKFSMEVRVEIDLHQVSELDMVDGIFGGEGDQVPCITSCYEDVS